MFEEEETKGQKGICTSTTGSSLFFDATMAHRAGPHLQGHTKPPCVAFHGFVDKVYDHAVQVATLLYIATRRCAMGVALGGPMQHP